MKSGPTSKWRVLAVDDDADDFARIKRRLAGFDNWDFEVDHAECLSAALGCLAKRRFDIVLVDLNLPDSSGVETCRELHRAAPQVPIVVLTELDDEQTALAALEMGAQDYLAKGQLRPGDLSRAIRYAKGRALALESVFQRDSQLKLISSQLPACIWTTDSKLRIMSSLGTGLRALRTSDQVRDLFGLFQTTDSGHPVIKSHARALAGKSISIDWQWRRRMFHLHVEPLRDSSRQIIGTVGAALDISDQKRMESDLVAARQVQQTLFPKTAPKLDGYDLAGAVFPAVETTGDYFDFFTLPNGDLCTVVADVSGHGLGPSLLMAEVRAYLRVLTCSHCELDVILARANELITMDGDMRHFITMFLGRLQTRRRMLTYGGAGHPGFLLRAGGQVAELKSTGPPLGMGQHCPIAESKPIPLQRGDLLLVVTDGFWEAMKADEEMYGHTRMLELVHRNRNRTAREIIDVLHRSVGSFIVDGEQRDDMASIVIKVTS